MSNENCTDNITEKYCQHQIQIKSKQMTITRVHLSRNQQKVRDNFAILLTYIVDKTYFRLIPLKNQFQI